MAMNEAAPGAADLSRVREQQRQTWDRFSAGWKKWDADVLAWLAPFGTEMIRHAELQDDFEVLDVAAGTGEPGLTAASSVPLGRVTLTDLAEQMLAVAVENAADRGLHNVGTRLCDAAALPFPDATFDAVLCRFGFMFFPDIAATAAEFVRVAKPGARVCAAVWAEPARNTWATTVMAAINRHVELPRPAEGAPGLFRCATPGFLSDVFAEAGLRDVVEDHVSCDLVLATPQQYWDFMNDVAAPVVAGLTGVDGATRARIHGEVIEQAQRCRRDGSIRLQSTAAVVVGTR